MIAMTLRSIARAPVGGPRGASTSGCETRAAYHRTAPRTNRRKSAVAIGMSVAVSIGAGSAVEGHRVRGVSFLTADGFRRTGFNGDLARAVDRQGEAVHRPRRRALDDLTVAVVDRAVAGALEPTVVDEGHVAPVRRSGHGRVAIGKRHRAAQMRAFPVQREEALGHPRYVELALADDLDVTHLEVRRVARDDGPTEGPEPLRGEEAHEPNAPLAEQHQDRPPAHPAEH